MYGDNNKVVEEAQLYTASKSIVKKNHPLMIMVSVCPYVRVADGMQ